MQIYLITFFLSFIFVYFGNNVNIKILRYFFFSLAILFPSLLAGYRDETVGYDILIYAVPCFNEITDINNLKELYLYIDTTGLEPLYILFNYIVTRFTDDIFWAFFLQQIIVLSLILFTCYRLRYKINLPIIYFSYLLFNYCNSMSANRQVFAIAIIFYSFYYVINNNLKKYIICIIIAVLFHNSAIFTIPIYFMYNYAIKIKGEIKISKLFYIIVIGVSFYIFFPIILNFLISSGLINSKYERYMNAEYNFHKIDAIIMSLMYLISLFNYKYYVYNNILKLFIISTIFIILCGQYNDVASRMALYYILFIFINISRLASKMYNGKIIMNYFILLIFAQYLYLAYTTGFSEAIPYTSRQLGI